MARVFNIYFDFEGLTYSSMVAVKHTPFFTEYVLNIDDELLQHLPSNVIIATCDGDLRFQTGKPHVNASLMRAILLAVADHLKAGTVAF
jgi:hypothetical protein